MKKLIQTHFNYFSFEMPLDAVLDCSHKGRCDDDVEYWQSKLNLNLNREKMFEELKEYGAWTSEELKALEDYELEQKVIWIGACNAKDEMRDGK